MSWTKGSGLSQDIRKIMRRIMYIVPPKDCLYTNDHARPATVISSDSQLTQAGPHLLS